MIRMLAVHVYVQRKIHWCLNLVGADCEESTKPGDDQSIKSYRGQNFRLGAK